MRKPVAPAGVMWDRGLLIDEPHEGFIGSITETKPMPMCTRFPRIARKKWYPERLIITVVGCIIRVTTWFMSKSPPPPQ